MVLPTLTAPREGNLEENYATLTFSGRLKGTFCKEATEGHGGRTAGQGRICVLSARVVSDRGRHLERGQLLCLEILRDAIPQGGGNQETQKSHREAERTDLRGGPLLSASYKKTAFGKRQGEETLPTDGISSRPHSPGKTPETFPKIPNQERHLEAAKVDQKVVRVECEP